MKKILKYACGMCCGKDNGSPCVLQIGDISGVVEPVLCPYGSEYVAEWELSQKAHIVDDLFELIDAAKELASSAKNIKIQPNGDLKVGVALGRLLLVAAKIDND